MVQDTQRAYWILNKTRCRDEQGVSSSVFFNFPLLSHLENSKLYLTSLAISGLDHEMTPLYIFTDWLHWSSLQSIYFLVLKLRGWGCDWYAEPAIIAKHPGKNNEWKLKKHIDNGRDGEGNVCLMYKCYRQTSSVNTFMNDLYWPLKGQDTEEHIIHPYVSTIT